MTRRVIVVGLLLFSVATFAAAKIKPEDQQYFDGQFKALLEQIQQLKTQQDALNAQLKEAGQNEKAQTDALHLQLTELSQNQSHLQSIIQDQQRVIDGLSQLIAAMRDANSESLKGIRADLTELRAQHEKLLNAVNAQAGEGPGSKPAQLVGYIAGVDKTGSIVTINMGSAQGMHVGSRLGLYKQDDPKTRVGALEVTDVVDAEVSHARVVTVNSGVQPQYSDQVRPE